MDKLAGWQIFILALIGALVPAIAVFVQLVIAIRDFRVTRKVDDKVTDVQRKVNGGFMTPDQVEQIVRRSLSQTSLHAVSLQAGKEIRERLTADLREMVRHLLAELMPVRLPPASPETGKSTERQSEP